MGTIFIGNCIGQQTVIANAFKASHVIHVTLLLFIPGKQQIRIFFEPNRVATIVLLLRRTLQGSVLFSAIK